MKMKPRWGNWGWRQGTGAKKNNKKALDEVLTPPSSQELDNLLKSNLEFCYKFSLWIFFK